MPEVIVLSTLHQNHGKLDYFDYSKLSEIIERLAPTVLFVELTEQDLVDRKDQRNKQEYPQSVFPLLEKYDYVAVPLEPAEPTYSELIGLSRTAVTETNQDKPEEVARFRAFHDGLKTMLRGDYWDSAASVNSSLTDSVYAIKHAFQNALYGEAYQRSWEGWNGHFLDVILRVAGDVQEGRLVVLVGFEHGYWLRQKLKHEKRVRLLDTEQLLREMGL